MIAGMLGSQGPFGPTPLGCLLVAVILFAPFVLLALAAWSLVRAAPLPAWLLGAVVLATAGLAYFLKPWTFPSGHRGFWGAWCVAGIAAMAALPVVGEKRGQKPGGCLRA